MISINLTREWIEDFEYNIFDHLEKQEVDVVSTKQEFFEDDPSGDMEAPNEEIKKEGLEHAISKTTCASGDLYSESIDGEVLKRKYLVNHLQYQGR